MKVRVFVAAGWIMMSVVTAVSCCRVPEPDVPEHTKRTLIAYVAGDNNLSYEVKSKISALSEGFADVECDRNRLVVFADYRDDMPELIEITDSGPVTVETYASMNSADPDNLESILARIVSLFPAESYGLICFSHASGWLPEGALSDPVGYREESEPSLSPSTIFQDGSDEMAIDDFARALRLPDGARFDYIILEACYMAGIEIAYELKDVADYLVASASEILSPGFLESYKGHLNMLFEDDADVVGFARTYFDYWNSMSGAMQSATVSVIDLNNVSELAEQISLVERNGHYLISDPTDIQHFNRGHYHLFFDLTEYLAAVAGRKDDPLLDNYYPALEKTVIYTDATESFMTGYPYSFRIRANCGLTTYIMQPDLETLNEDYKRTTYYIDILSGTNNL